MAEREVIAASVELIRDYVSEIRNSLAKIRASFSTRRSQMSKKDVALARWHVYLAVSANDAASAIAELANGKATRAVIILNRCVYEYLQKAKFFDRNRKIAFEQFASIGARRFAITSRLDNPLPELNALFVTDYLEWKRTSGTRDEYSGNRAVSAMHVALAKAENVKVAKDGSRYTTAFETAYSVPSLYVHADPVLMRDVFPGMKDDHDWRLVEDESLLGIFGQLGLTNAYLMEFLSVLTERYGRDRKKVGRLATRGKAIAVEMVRLGLT